jgi:hypothetical protein
MTFLGVAGMVRLAAPGAAVTDTDWLTGPRATVIAASIAVLGTLVAFAGVWRTTNTTRKETRRKERLDVLVDCATALRNYTLPLLGIGRAGEDAEARAKIVSRFTDDAVFDLNNSLGLAHNKLALYNFMHVFDAVQRTASRDIRLWDQVLDQPDRAIEPVDYDDLSMHYIKATAAFRDAIAKLK